MTLRNFIQTASTPVLSELQNQPQLASLEESETGFERVFGEGWKALGHLCHSALDGWHIVTKDDVLGVLLIRQTRRYGVFMRIGVLEVRRNNSCAWDEFLGVQSLKAVLSCLEPTPF